MRERSSIVLREASNSEVSNADLLRRFLILRKLFTAIEITIDNILANAAFLVM